MDSLVTMLALFIACPACGVCAQSSTDEEPRVPKWAASVSSDIYGSFALLPVGNGRMMKMRFCPAGELRTQRPSDQIITRPVTASTASELAPVHEGVPRAFWICEHEVTEGIWREVWGLPAAENGQLPIVGRTWGAAWRFCRLLDRRLGNVGIRLPTSTEWEYAARAGARGTAPPEDMLTKMEWPLKIVDGVIPLAPVAKRQPNAWGIYDCLGNAMEYCCDFDAQQRLIDAVIIRGAVPGVEVKDMHFMMKYGMRIDESQPYVGFRFVVTAHDLPSPVNKKVEHGGAGKDTDVDRRSGVESGPND